MDTLFLQILKMSLTASYVILFVIAARLLLKKAPKIFSYTLWIVVLFRLICPFSFESIFSLIPAKAEATTQHIMNSQTLQSNGNTTRTTPVGNNVLPGDAIYNTSDSPIQIWITLGKVVWLLGITVLLAYSIFTAIRLYLKLKSSKPISDKIYESGGIKTPFVFGILNPKIYLPTGLSDNERAYIIKHEQTHMKRFDHVIKPFAFFVLCVHWFNPLVWLAFFLMSEDMELSCDERVIKQMGSAIKKDYSTSLLSLSTGKRIIAGCPLAFGENNTKGRIMNILNYKKPGFWVVFIAVIAVVAVCVGLMSNPKKYAMTVEDYANEYVEQDIASHKKNYGASYKIIDSNITKLEKIASYDAIYSSPLEIWSFEYRLKPDDASKVMFAGGMYMADGWIIDESGGKLMLIFSYENSKPQYLGSMWSLENLTTLASQETALRKFLEGAGLLPHETYSGNHILIKFPLSLGDISQLFLSQPVIQGERGIWCVERWKDTNGNEYYVTPQTDGLTIDYYRDLQEQCDQGHQPSLLDPLQVALNYTNTHIGIDGLNLTLEDLTVQYDATFEDFSKTPESHFTAYITKFSVNDDGFNFDRFEWLTSHDTVRLKELNIDPDDLPNGYYIHNYDTYSMHGSITEQTQYHLINRSEEAPHISVNKKDFSAYLEQYSDFSPPFKIIIKDGYVLSITEIYVP